MYVAICDDNAIDRKYLERLLSREADKRANAPSALKVDSFGDAAHFLVNPLKYNIIFMDMCFERGTATAIIDALVAMEYSAPLILYSSRIDYSQLPNLPDFVYHAKKPYMPEDLPGFLALGDRNALRYDAGIKLHQNGAEIKVSKDETECAAASKKGSTIYMADGTRIDVDEDIANLRQILSPYEEFGRVNKNGIANFKFVSAVTPFHVIMQSSFQFSISPFRYREFKFLKDELKHFD